MTLAHGSDTATDDEEGGTAIGNARQPYGAPRIPSLRTLVG
ncbi:hypothetical protein ACGFYV_32805 [Streptomyces sp. NPDC048297]